MTEWVSPQAISPVLVAEAMPNAATNPGYCFNTKQYVFAESGTLFVCYMSLTKNC